MPPNPPHTHTHTPTPTPTPHPTCLGQVVRQVRSLPDLPEWTGLHPKQLCVRVCVFACLRVCVGAYADCRAKCTVCNSYFNRGLMTRVKDRSANVCGVHNLVTTGVTTADHPSNLCSLRLVVRTPGFHLGNRSSTLLGSTSFYLTNN